MLTSGGTMETASSTSTNASASQSHLRFLFLGLPKSSIMRPSMVFRRIDPNPAASVMLFHIVSVLKGHDRGTLWVACRMCRKICAGFSPCGNASLEALHRALQASASSAYR
jgi:hypothetical protein